MASVRPIQAAFLNHPLDTDRYGRVMRLTQVLADVLIDEWERLAEHLTRSLAKEDDDPVESALNSYDWTGLADALSVPDVQIPLAEAHSNGQQHAAFDLGVAWQRSDPRALAYARDRAAELVGMRRTPSGGLVSNPSARWTISETTRDELHRLITDTIETPGVSYRDLKAHIEALPAFSGLFGEYRAETIARTELALAVNAGTLDTFGEYGGDRVIVHDSPDCGWLRHDDPDKPNGTTRTLADAKAHPVSHPHCVRSFSLAPGGD